MSLSSTMMSFAKSLRLKDLQHWPDFASRFRSMVELGELEEAFSVPRQILCVEPDSQESSEPSKAQAEGYQNEDQKSGEIRKPRLAKLASVLANDDPDGISPHAVLKMSDAEWNAFYSSLSREKVAMRKKTYSLLQMTIDRRYNHLVASRRDPAHAWAKLRSAVEGSPQTRALLLLTRLYRQKLDDHKGDFNRYAACIESTYSELKALKKDPGEEAIVAALICGLPRGQFETVQELLLQKERLTLTEAINTVQSFVMRRNELRQSEPRQAKGGIVEVTPAYGLSGEENGRKYFGNSNRKSESGGFQKKPKSAGFGAKSGGRSSKIRCYRCQQLGHIARNCNNKPKEREGGDDDDKANKIGNFDTLWTLEEKMKATALSQYAVIDGGCTRHCFKDRRFFVKLEQDPGRGLILGDGKTRIKSEGKGDVKLKVQWGTMVLKDVAFVPKIGENFISRRKLKQDGYRAIDDDAMEVYRIYKNGKMLCATDPELSKSLYLLPCAPANSGRSGREEQDYCNAVDRCGSRACDRATRWHQTFCHMPMEKLRELAKCVKGLPMNDLKSSVGSTGKPSDACDACRITKARRFPFAKSKQGGTDERLHTIHADIKTVKTQSGRGHTCYVVLVDEATRYVTARPLRRKDIFEAYTEWAKAIELKLGKKIKRFHSDGGGEFISNALAEWHIERGVEMTASTPYSPQQNGMAERAIQAIHEGVRVVLKQSGMPVEFWDYALEYVTYTRNRTLNRGNSSTKTPFELMFGKKPDVRHMVPFGCIGYARRNIVNAGGFGDRGIRCRMFGYDNNHGTYRVLLQGDRSPKRVRNVIFYPTKFKFPPGNQTMRTREIFENDRKMSAGPASEPSIDAEDELEPPGVVGDGDHASREDVREAVVPDGDPENERKEDQPLTERKDDEILFPEQVNAEGEEEHEDSEEAFETRASGRSGKGVPPARFGIHYAMGELRDHDFLFSINCEPGNFSEANRDPEWRAAMATELKALEKNGTWKIVKRRKGMKVVGSKWVFKAKTDELGRVYKKKARFVARGFTQRGVSFDDKFSPTVRITTIRVMIAYSARTGNRMTSADINNAYLHGVLDEPVHMEIPPNYNTKFDPKSFVCEVKKGLYGLMPSGKAWNRKCDAGLKAIGFKRSQVDPCLYILRKPDGGEVLLALYVDDMVMSDNNKALRDEVVRALNSLYPLKDQGELNFVLGIRVQQRSDGISLSQEAYIESVLEKFGLQGEKACSLPISPTAKIDRDENGKPANEAEYRSIVGAVAYVMTCTRPDIAFAVSKLSRYLNSPTEAHMRAARDLLRYLKGTAGQSLFYPAICSEEMRGLTQYVDADFAGCMDTRRSTTGLLFLLNGGLICWKSKRQSVPALSTAEAEYIALAMGIHEGKWLLALTQEIGFFEITSIRVLEDNQACIRIAKNPVLTQRSKAIDIKYHYARHYVASGTFKIEYIDTKRQLADVLTKAVPIAALRRFREIIFK